MGRSMVAIVTGANRGIGKAIVQSLAESFDEPLIIYAASRRDFDLDLPTSSKVQVRYPELDITDPASVDKLANNIRNTHDTVDVLINNAASHDAKDHTPRVVKTVLDTNVRGTLRMCKAFIPLLSKNGRVVNVSSTDSSLTKYSMPIQQRFRNPKLTLNDIETMLQEYYACVVEGSERENGWPESAYSVSKASTNALTVILARENPGLIVNCCCPGWVDTDMGSIAGSRPPKSPKDGAKIPIRLGFEDISGTTGRYWGNRSVADTGSGQIMDW